MDDFYIDAVMYCYKDIQDHLHYDDVITDLISCYVVTIQEKQDLDALQVGSITKSGRLLDLLFVNKRNMKTFVNVLNESELHKPLANLVEMYRNKIIMGKEPMQIKVIQNHLKAVYKDNDFNLIQKLPGERFMLDISDEGQIMPLDLTVQVIDRDKTRALQRRISTSSNMFYTQIELENIDDVFTCKEYEGSDNRMILCTGVAGIGKTVTLHRLTWQWAVNKNVKNLSQFDFVFLIPLATVDKEQTVINILGLSSKQGGLGLITESQMHTLHQHILENGENVLFALDGGDEIELSHESELMKLLTGEIYPKAKVFITVRSGNSLLTKLEPGVKIHINGTSDEGIRTHIRSSFIINNSSQADEFVEIIFAKCQRFTSSVDMMYVPLYLTLFTILFDQHWVQYTSISDFTIPRNMTELFNAFTCVIIKIWLQRLNRIKEAEQCSFTSSPLVEDSGVPVDICAKLFHMGRMSYEFLFSRQFVFSEKDFKRYFIDIEDVDTCGFFVKRQHLDTAYETKASFQFRHHIFQEYLAAVYLADVGFKDGLLRDTCNVAHTIKTETTLEECLSPLQQCAKFVFGMSPSLGMEMLEKVINEVSFAYRKHKFLVLDLVYESQLFLESNDEKFVACMSNKLLKTCLFLKRNVELNKYTNNFLSVDAFIKRLPDDVCIHLLQHVYALTVDVNPQTEVATINRQSNRSCTINNLDTTTYSLLSRFRFGNTAIKIEKSMIFDVKRLQKIFPFCKHLDICGPQISSILMNDLKLQRSRHSSCMSECDSLPPGSNVISLKMQSQLVASSLPPDTINSLLAEEYLEKITLEQVDIFENAPPIENFFPRWENLTELVFNSSDIYEEYIEYICKILTVTKVIQKVHIENSYGETCSQSEATKLIESFEELPDLRHIGLIHLFEKEASAVYSRIFVIKSVIELAIGEWDILDMTLETINQINNSNIKKLVVYIWHNSEDTLLKRLENVKTDVEIQFYNYIA